MTHMIAHLAEQDAVLCTRQRGREAADRIQDALEPGAGLVLDFTSVEAVTPSFLNELLLRLRALVTPDDAAILVVTGMNEDVAETVRLVLEHGRLMLAHLADGNIELLGGNRHLEETLDVAQKLGSFTAPELASELDVKLPNLHQRLNALLGAGALLRERDETAQHGKRFRYQAADPDALTELTSA